MRKNKSKKSNETAKGIYYKELESGRDRLLVLVKEEDDESYYKVKVESVEDDGSITVIFGDGDQNTVDPGDEDVIGVLTSRKGPLPEDPIDTTEGLPETVPLLWEPPEPDPETPKKSKGKKGPKKGKKGKETPTQDIQDLLKRVERVEEILEGIANVLT